MHSDTGGYYVKIGNMVWITGSVRWSALNKDSAQDTVLVKLPFATMARSNGDNSDGPGPVRCSSSNGSIHPNYCAAKPNQSNMFFYHHSTGSAGNVYAVGEQGTTCHFQYTLCYRAA